MGGAASKATRKLPKRPETPSWAGVRTPLTEHPPGRQASEVKNESIQEDGGDPHFLQSLNRLGPVRVDHHMKTIRPAVSETGRLFKSRAQSEYEASLPQPIHNRLHAATLSQLLDERKSAKSQQDLEQLTKRYNIDVTKLKNLTRFVSTPSIQGGTAVRMVEKDGEESLTTTAVWIEPRI